jgi:hypothetical protein
MIDTENNEQEPESDEQPSASEAPADESSDGLASSDPPIVIQGGGSGNP